ncbi:MAG: hypothetical protein QOJ73_594, partial [Streptosporangiaceae bacterium]|nr:hypothetical protein [Streptosporangiaceae bacterium]
MTPSTGAVMSGHGNARPLAGPGRVCGGGCGQAAWWRGQAAWWQGTVAVWSLCAHGWHGTAVVAEVAQGRVA